MRRFSHFLLILVFLAAGSCSSDSPTAPGVRLVYAALGASDAVGIGASPLTAGYVFLIANDLGEDREVDLRNLGEIGAHSFDMIARQLGSAISASPGLVTIWTGSNDIIGGDAVSSFAADVDQMLGDLRSQTDAQIFIGDLVDLSLIPRFLASPDPDVTSARVNAFNNAITNAAARHSAHVVPLSMMPINLDFFAIDGFHPSSSGHRAIADTFLDEIRRVL